MSGAPSPRFRLAGSVAPALLIALALAACARTEIPVPGRRHVLLVSVDTLRPDYLSWSGYDRPTSPFLDSIFAEAVVFTRALTPVPRTTQALASLLTGSYPHAHGVRFLFDALDPEVPSLPELARRGGYRTFAIVSNHLLVPERGLDRGFDVYDHGPDARDAADTTRAALGRLAGARPDDALFVWVHYVDPHVPYFPPPATAETFDPGYEGRYRQAFGAIQGGTGDRAYPVDLPKREAVYRNPLSDAVNAHLRRLYAAEVRGTDDAISALLRELRTRVGDDWLVIFTADHGESLGEHGYFYDHGEYVSQPELHVPLAFLLPRADPLRRAARVEHPVSLVDVMPTLVGLLGLELPAGARVDGRSLVPDLAGEARAPAPVFAESGTSYYPDRVRRRVRFDVAGRFRAVVDGDWKLVWTPGLPEDRAYELYDLSTDPGETRDLFRPDHPEAQRLRALLEGWLRDAPERPREPSAEDLERMRSLGYVE